MTSPNVYISTPCYTGKVDINYHTSMLMTMKYLGENRIQHMFNYAVSTGVDAARSKHATEFLTTKCTHLMMIDDDMAWAPDLVHRLIMEDVDIIGVPYRRKIVSPVSFTARHEFDIEYKQQRPYLVKVDGIGCGMTLVKREVVEALEKNAPKIQYNKDGPLISMIFRHEFVEDEYLKAKTYMSEDYKFCRDARESGFEIWAYVDEEVAHMGTVAFRGKYAEVLEKGNESKLRNDHLKMTVRLVGESPPDFVDFPVRCTIDGIEKVITTQCRPIEGGVLIPKSAINPVNQDAVVYLAKVKELYHIEEIDEGLKVFGLKELSA